MLRDDFEVLLLRTKDGTVHTYEAGQFTVKEVNPQRPLNRPDVPQGRHLEITIPMEDSK